MRKKNKPSSPTKPKPDKAENVDPQSPVTEQSDAQSSCIEDDQKELKNSRRFLGRFMGIPPHMKNYKDWKMCLQEKHKDFSLLSSPPSGVEKSQLVDGINVELLKEHYKMQIELYGKYLDLLIKFNFLDFAITGGILAFALQNPDKSFIRWAFAFPLFMNLFFAILILLAFWSLKAINREIIYMSRFLGFQPPGVRTLRHALAVSSTVLTLIALWLTPTAVNKDFYILGALNLNKYNSGVECKSTNDCNGADGKVKNDDIGVEGKAKNDSAPSAGATTQEASPSPEIK